MHSDQTLQELLQLWNQTLELESQLDWQYQRLNLKPVLLSIPMAKTDRVIDLNDLVYVQSESRRCRFFMASGESFLSNTGLNFSDALHLLGNYPQFQRVNETVLANMQHVSQMGSHPQRLRDFALHMAGGYLITVPESRSGVLKRWFQLDSLRKIKPFHQRWGNAFYQENLRPFNKELRLMSADELKNHFNHPRTNRFNTHDFMANFIWEYYQLLQRGLREPVQGNIRTFWYVLKPTLAKAVTIQGQKQYAKMLNTFQRMVVKHRLFKFHDFGFINEGEQYYQIGERYPQIILVSEKTGHYKRLQAIQKEFGITLIALGGMPSILTTEYFSQVLWQAIPAKAQNQGLHILSLTDYNPSGAIILKSFTTQLTHEGLKQFASIRPLLVPSLFTPDELQAITEPLPLHTQADKTKAEKWIAAGGGVNGQPLGIESESLVMDTQRFKEVFRHAFEQAIKPSRKKLKQSYTPTDIQTSENLFLLK